MNKMILSTFSDVLLYCPEQDIKRFVFYLIFEKRRSGSLVTIQTASRLFSLWKGVRVWFIVIGC